MTVSHGYISTLDVTTGGNVLDYSPVMFAKPVPGGELNFWDMVQKASDCTDTIFYWMEDSLVEQKGHASEAWDTSETDLTFDDTSMFQAGDLIRDITTAGATEVVSITSVDSATACTVVRGYGGTSGEAHDDDSYWEIIGHTNPESSGVSDPYGRVPTRRSNYTTILDTYVKMSGTELARQHHSIPNYWDYQVEGVLTKFKRDLEKHLFWSEPIARATTSIQTYGTMGGIRSILRDRAVTGNYATSVGAFSYSVWDNAIKSIWTNGYTDGQLVTILPPSGAQVAAYIHESAFRAQYMGDTTRGMRASALMSTLGMETPIMVSANIAADEFLILDMSRIKVHFMPGRELIAMDLPRGTNGNDYAARRFLTELTLEVHNADAHYYGCDVTYTVPS